ncbi:MAG: cobalamin-dependent protein [Candidatus Methanomethylophilus sp.]|nr:cobalamin-dependent protein [Methanomethylophilus sp.]
MPDAESILGDMKLALETLDRDGVLGTLEAALSAGIGPETIISDGLSKGMDTIGRRFDDGELFLPQVLLASKIMDEAMEFLSREMNTGNFDHYRAIIVMGTVSGDIHDIGKNVCVAMLKGARYKVIDIGNDVSPEDFVKAISDSSADAVGASSLMTTTLVAQKKLVETMEEFDCRALKLFGGAPCSEEWVKSIGGDGYSSNGHDMVLLVDRMLKK